MERTGQRNSVILRLEISDSDRALASVREDVDYISDKQEKIEEAVRIVLVQGRVLVEDRAMKNRDEEFER